MKIKVCGTRERENIIAITDLGVDMLGFIFYEKSPRFVRAFPLNDVDLNEKNFFFVGVFVNETIEKILEKIRDFRLSAVQLHGQESPLFIAQLREKMPPEIQIFKALGIDEAFDFTTLMPYETFCDLFIFDTKTPLHGGSGLKFDWKILENYQGKTPFLLSGGIEVEDANLIKQLTIKQLKGVDLNSKFEFLPALKDITKLNQFIKDLLL